MIRGIAFDLFDTLVDQNHDRLAPIEVSGRLVGATTPALHARAHAGFGVPLDTLEFSDLMRDVDRELRVDTIDQGLELSTLDRFTALGTRLELPSPLEFGQALTEVHMGILARACTVPSHHEAIMTSLAVDHPLAICSNFSHAATAREILREAALDQHFQTILISEEIGIRKPRREIFDAVCTGLDLAPEEILHVGDNLSADVAGAAALGMKTVWLTRQIADPDRMLAEYLETGDGPAPDFALEDMLDLPVLAARLA